jgi:signal transduction histidine kinase
MENTPPIPVNEMERIIRLSELDLDYSDIQESLKDLTKLAAKVAGTSISLINLIDTFTQWTVARYGLDLEQMPREESVCQYTIVSEESFEVPDLTTDDRFKDKFYVTGAPKVTYYFGIPLQTNDGHNLGALCVLDQVGREISPEKVELLKIIANEIVNRLTAIKVIQQLQSTVKEAKETQRKVAHDIRGPLGGIISLAQIISDQGDSNKMDQVLEFINLIQKSGKSLLELANEILTNGKPIADTTVESQPEKTQSTEFNLLVLKDKLEKLYSAQAKPKNISFSVNIMDQNGEIPFSKNKILQIAGNLISNAIKFTPENGKVTVDLGLVIGQDDKKLQITVKDTGIGLTEEAIQNIQNGTVSSTEGTEGEQGYGFGLSLVKHLLDGMKGSLLIASKPGHGAEFSVRIPQN